MSQKTVFHSSLITYYLIMNAAGGQRLYTNHPTNLKFVPMEKGGQDPPFAGFEPKDHRRLESRLYRDPNVARSELSADIGALAIAKGVELNLFERAGMVRRTFDALHGTSVGTSPDSQLQFLTNSDYVRSRGAQPDHPARTDKFFHLDQCNNGLKILFAFPAK
jgi:hypothetical protein